MARSIHLCLGALAATFVALVTPVHADGLIETPSLKAKVEAGKLPPVNERVPMIPKVVDLPAQGRKNGRHGGKMRMLMGREKDVRMMAYYGYSRLIGYNHKLEFEPDILHRIDVSEGREFTLHLRPGHKWSDGHPFTAEDFRFYWEDKTFSIGVSIGLVPIVADTANACGAVGKQCHGR